MSVRVSVIMACRNEAARLDPSLRSLGSQLMGDWELVVIDDGSTDQTADMLAACAGRDQRVRVFRNQVNEGLTRSLNRGIRMAQGRYLARLDAGDWFLPEKLERQLVFLEKHPEVILCGTQVIFVAEGREMGRSRFACEDAVIRRRFLTRQGIFCHPSIVFRNCGVGYNEEFKYSQDLDLYMRLGARGELAALDEYLTVCQQERVGLTVGNKYEQRQYQNAAYRLYARGAYAAAQPMPSVKSLIRDWAWERWWCSRGMPVYYRYMVARTSGQSGLIWGTWLVLSCLLYPPFALDYWRKLWAMWR